MSSLTRLEPGAIVAGLYRIVRPLSEGGMGSVYVAEQVSTRKERALKLMRAELVSSEKMRERFTQEAHVGSKIDSEHVVEVIDAGIDHTLGVPWLAMELLKGRTLAQACEASGAMTAPAVRELFSQLCHALGAAHQAGIVHRDLKPENIFLATARREGVPYTLKVLDFGIAKLVSEATTRSTAAIGTPLFMPPEQMTPGRSITPAADVWALGLIAFLTLTGKHYWHAGNQELSSAMMLLNEVTNLPIDPASQRARELGCANALPPGFDAWFARCVNRDIEQRYRDARELRGGLDAVLGSDAASHDPLATLATGSVTDGAPNDALTTARLETGPTFVAPVGQHMTPMNAGASGGGVRLHPATPRRVYSGWVIAAGGITAALAIGFVVLGGMQTRDAGSPANSPDAVAYGSSRPSQAKSTALPRVHATAMNDPGIIPASKTFAGVVQGPGQRTSFHVVLHEGYEAALGPGSAAVWYRKPGDDGAPVIQVTPAAHASLDAAVKAAVAAGLRILLQEARPDGWVIRVEGPATVEVRRTVTRDRDRLTCTAAIALGSSLARIGAANDLCGTLTIDVAASSDAATAAASVSPQPRATQFARPPKTPPRSADPDPLSK